MKYLAVLAFTAVLLAGCQTVPVPQREGRVRALVDIVNTAPLDELITYSQTPFAFDSELLVLSGDLDLLWGNLRTVGFSFDGAEIIDISPLEPDSYTAFAQSYEMRIFFEEYLSADGALVYLRHDSGEYILLVDKSRNRTPLLYGIKGPLL